MPITSKPTQMKYKDPTTGYYEPVVAAADLSDAIDDTTTSSTTLWSSQKTSQEIGTKVSDVQVNGTSVVTSGTANVPLADNSTFGVVKTHQSMGVKVESDGSLNIRPVSSALIKGGTAQNYAVSPVLQHEAVFYGLSKIAGADLASETVTTGTYPSNSKTAICGMIGAVKEPASDGTNGQVLTTDGQGGRSWTTVSGGGGVSDVQVDGTSVVTSGVANIPKGDAYGNLGVVTADSGYGTQINANGVINISSASDTNLKNGTQQYKPIVPYNQHASVYYGLSKLAGVDLKNETVTVGTYPATSKAAINTMIGSIQAPSSASAGDFLCYNGTSWVATTLSTWQGGSY